jgi:hypothetical protein
MHTFEFQQHFERFSADSEKLQTFIAVIADLANDADKMGENLLRIATGGSQQGEGAARLHGYLAKVHQTTSAVSQRQFFKSLEHFQTVISRFQSQHPKASDLVGELKNQVERFSDLYDVFITNGSGVNAVHVILAAKDLNARTNVFMRTLQMVCEQLGDHDVAGRTEDTLTLWLPGHFELGDFARRLLALNELYSEICMLLSVSLNEHPIRISKIESGSLWVKAFGESRVIGLMISFFKASASWGYRNYTTEGKISVIPQKVEAIDELLGLTGRLDAAGIDTSQMNEHIRKSALVITKELSVLLDKQSSVTINDETFSAGADWAHAISQNGVTPRIGNSTMNGRIEPTVSDQGPDTIET